MITSDCMVRSILCHTALSGTTVGISWFPNSVFRRASRSTLNAVVLIISQDEHREWQSTDTQPVGFDVVPQG
jgi:hypothetical protein